MNRLKYTLFVLIVYSTIFVVQTPQISFASSEQTSSEILQQFLRIFEGNDPNTYDYYDSSLNPTIAPSAIISPSTSHDPYIAHGDLIMYRQSDYTDPLPHGCTFNFAGCGPSAVANIVANLKDRSITPQDVLEEYRKQGSFLGCSGSTMEGARKVLEGSYGFTTMEIIPEGSAPLSIEQAVTKLLPFTTRGTWVFVGANFSGGGHYVVITDIRETEYGYDLYALDSVYGNRNVIPVNYDYMRPYPKIKKAMAVVAN